MSARNIRAIARTVWKHGAKITMFVATALVIIFGSLKDATLFFIDFFTTGLPTADEITRIQITIIILGLVAMGLLIWHTFRRKQPKPSNTVQESVVITASKANEQPENTLNENELMKGVWFYPKRSNDVLENFVEKVETEYIVIATAYGKFGYAEYRIKEILGKGASLTYYVLDPESPTFEAAQKAKLIARDSKEDCLEKIKKFCQFKQELGNDEKRRFKLHKYQEPPVHSMMIIDPQSDHAMMQIESYLYDTDEPIEQRPSIVISKKEQPELFKTYYRTVQWIIDHSKQHECDTPKGQVY